MFFIRNRPWPGPKRAKRERFGCPPSRIDRRGRFFGCPGFTVVEVLIASAILTTVLAVGTLAYRTVLDLRTRLAAEVRLADAVFPVQASVRIQLENGVFEGEGRYGAGVGYRWQAVEASRGQNVLLDRDEKTGGLALGRFQLILYRLSLELVLPKMIGEKKARYAYDELVWTKASPTQAGSGKGV